PLGIPNMQGQKDIVIYTNPVANHNVFIDNMPQVKKSDSWTYDLIDIAGKKITSQILSVTSGQANIKLDPALAPGVYYLSLKNNGSKVCTRPLNIVD
ncbi:MAG TPA: T9SS type A sorting domain-containing protein, partial [Flavipsychrobacter sp.]|nr:T9SS type A sorting domain-containing protein [Flavipsychrobacter sp.]